MVIKTLQTLLKIALVANVFVCSCLPDIPAPVADIDGIAAKRWLCTSSEERAKVESL